MSDPVTVEGDRRPRVLVVEDGHEYITNLDRFLAADFAFTRAGDGPQALALLAEAPFDVVFLDMRFDRAEALLGDLDELSDRFAGDRGRARRFLEDNQGTYVLAALRAAGHRQPALFSYDFGGEPRRLKNLEGRYAPVAWLSDAAGPADIRQALLRLSGGARR
ncbi:response regulator [Myxococcota bacterium]|nr:response regulator [Myxococcota bacterium]